MWTPILINIEIRSYDSLSINKSKAAILAINRYIKGLRASLVKAKSAKNSKVIKNSFSGLLEEQQSNSHNKCKSDKRNSTFPPIDLSYSETGGVLCEAIKRDLRDRDPSHGHVGHHVSVAKGAQRTGKEHKGVLKKNATIGTQIALRVPTHKQVSSNSNKLVSYVQSNKNVPRVTVTSNKLLEKYFSFPTKRKMFTVLRSPHIDKKSREHFQWKQSKMTVFLEFKKPGEWDLFLFILENARLPGVQLLVGCQYSTFCAF